MITTRQLFDNLLPAFRTPTGDIFSRMSPTIAQLETELIQLPDYARDYTESDIDLALRPYVAEAACTRAAYNLIPQLDLVLTPTGFGIVSNQNTAPASRERVAALREEMRHLASDKYYAYIEQLLQNIEPDSSFPEITVDTLFWNPTLANRYGLKLNGQTIYKEELETLKPQIVAAEMQLGKAISPYVMVDLRLMIYELGPDYPDKAFYSYYETAWHKARLCIANIVMGASQDVIDEHIKMFLEFIRDNEDIFYADNPTAEASKIKYENKKSDPSFFFG